MTDPFGPQRARRARAARVLVLAVAGLLGLFGSPIASADDARPADDGHVSPSGRAVAFTVRGGLDDWLGGKVSGAKIGDVFGAGPTLQLDVGLLVMRVVELYAGWQRGFYGVGSASPYALYAHASARGDYYMVGARMVCERPIGLMLDGDFGYLDFHSGASDGLGGSAAVDLPTLGLRVGAALCIRPIKQLLVAPGLYSIMAFSTGSYRSSLTTGGTTDATSGSVAGGSPYVGVSPGLWITGQLPF